MNRLEYCKVILKKISFDKNLLKKEYDKALKLLTENEAVQLSEWCQRELSVYAPGFLNKNEKSLKR
ncbi:MAG TPA: hypothetical protein PLV21_03670 [Cyclobacteriaceae bacterium]|nr:hypothetical protein [Cyclobacteriaceae bacterium]HRJ80957.1 hypothetical protein [Cyclobacteriaceae bacterium]